MAHADEPMIEMMNKLRAFFKQARSLGIKIKAIELNKGDYKQLISGRLMCESNYHTRRNSPVDMSVMYDGVIIINEIFKDEFTWDIDEKEHSQAKMFRQLRSIIQELKI